MSKKYFNAVDYMDVNLDRFDRLGFFFDTLLEWEHLHRQELSSKIVSMIDSVLTKNSFREVIEFACSYQSLPKKAQIRELFTRKTNELLIGEPSIRRLVVGNTAFVVFASSFGVYEAETMMPLGTIRLGKDEFGDVSLVFKAICEEAHYAKTDLKLFLNDKPLLHKVYEFLESEYQKKDKGAMS
jgi:hypothetical protein